MTDQCTMTERRRPGARATTRHCRSRKHDCGTKESFSKSRAIDHDTFLIRTSAAHGLHCKTPDRSLALICAGSGASITERVSNGLFAVGEQSAEPTMHCPNSHLQGTLHLS